MTSPIPIPSYGGSRYVLTFLYDYLIFCSVYFLELKYEVFEQFKIWKSLVENQSGHRIKIHRNDNGTEYLNKIMHQICEECGIQMQHSNPYIPQQNDVTERKNRSLKEMDTSMIKGKDISPKLWDESINCAAHIKNTTFQKLVK